MTVGGWMFHYLWAVCIARGLNIAIPIPTLIAAMTAASILNALPIAPSGLGTRDAAFLLLLTPYGAESERILALSLLMFVQLLLVAIPGGCYWLWGKKDEKVGPDQYHPQDRGTLLM